MRNIEAGYWDEQSSLLENTDLAEGKITRSNIMTTSCFDIHVVEDIVRSGLRVREV